MSAKSIASWLDNNQQLFTEMADEIWANPELQFKEFKASKLQADFMEEAGFDVTWDLGGMSTAFVAEWGTGEPVIGFIGEYDALPGLSQKLQSDPEAEDIGGPGHGCGHNLLGTGAVAAAMALKHQIELSGQTATIRYYGCPAEEGGAGKAFMARDGIFDDLDAAFNFHPGYYNTAMKGSMLGVNHVIYRFHGQTAHAGANPHLGRSALDAVELMNVGVNYLREHVPDHVRIHYVITNGGAAPNIVPDLAEVRYYIRAHLPPEVEAITERVRKVAQGAAMMTETRLEEIYESGSSSVLSNHILADLQFDVMGQLGAVEFSEEEVAYADQVNSHFPASNKDAVARRLGLTTSAGIKSLMGDYVESRDAGRILTASTDVGDLSWVVPVSMLSTSCWPTAVPGHSWGIVATGGMSIGHKGMMYAAKVMAGAALKLVEEKDILTAVRTEFEAQTAEMPYQCPIPDDVKPPSYPHPLRS